MEEDWFMDWMNEETYFLKAPLNSHIPKKLPPSVMSN